MPDKAPDLAFRALANSHRRQLLLALLERNPQAEVSVSDEIRLDQSEEEELRSKLYHTHLPRLEQHGYIEWDRKTRTVRKGPNFEEIRPLLELLHRNRADLPDGWV